MAAQAHSKPATTLLKGLDEAVNRLSDADRQVIVAHYFQGQSYAEVGCKLGVPEATAQKRGVRGLERLRQYLAKAGAPALSVAALTSLLSAEASAAPLATSQVAAIQAAATGSTANVQVTALADLALKTMFWAKMKIYAAIAATVAVVAVPATVLLRPADAGLVGHYTFAEGSGTTVRDASRSGNHGTLQGNVARVAGPRPGSKALNFDGKTGYVKLDKDLNQWLGGTATAAFWINTRQVGVDFPPVCVAGVDVVGTTNDVQWGFLDESGRIGVNAGDLAAVNMAKSSQPINDGQWHHVALTRDAVLGRSQVYVDGKLSSATATGAKGNKTTPFFSIGRKEVFPSDAKDKTVYYFQGALAEVRFHDRVLSAAEIEALAK